ncbi:MAG: hypothetical protein ACRYG8_18265 [Janthinobacterium lividum]
MRGTGPRPGGAGRPAGSDDCDPHRQRVDFASLMAGAPSSARAASGLPNHNTASAIITAIDMEESALMVSFEGRAMEYCFGV